MEKIKLRNSLVNYDKNFHVLFVCTGNLCRSPMAEGILIKKLDEANINNISVCSAGTIAVNGSLASNHAVLVAQESNIDLQSHQATLLNYELLKCADIILVMEKYHYQAIRDVFPFAFEKTFLLKNFGLKNALEQEVVDPMGMSMDFYRACFEELEREIVRILPIVVKMASLK